MHTAFITAFIQIRFLDIIDIILVALLIYYVFRLIRGTGAINIVLGIIAIYAVWFIVRTFEMELLTEILGQFISVGVLALIIVFQPEIRKFLLLLGQRTILNQGSKSFWKKLWQIEDEVPLNYTPIIRACEILSENRTGALIVITKENSLDYFLETGEFIDAKLSDQLIQNIFFRNSPLHDGAIIITNNRIKAARCVLPVSESAKLPTTLGLRHRAALGITEQSDALALVVSEQTGKIAFCQNAEITRNVSLLQLRDILTKEFTGYKQNIEGEGIKQ
ncbi:MAG: diadenylate cyclase CdaA [Bacteroidota bacterium]